MDPWGPLVCNREKGAAEDEGKSGRVSVISGSSDGNETVVEGPGERVEDFSMSKETNSQSRPFYGICGNRIRCMDV